jgi:hypothetical protein
MPLEAASPPLCFLGCRACYGSVPPASRLLCIACGDGLKAGLDPGASTSPGGRKSGQARACPPLRRAARSSRYCCVVVARTWFPQVRR